MNVFFKRTQINGDAAENLNSRALNSDGEFVDLLMIPVSELHEHLNSKSTTLYFKLSLVFSSVLFFITKYSHTCCCTNEMRF